MGPITITLTLDELKLLRAGLDSHYLALSDALAETQDTGDALSFEYDRKACDALDARLAALHQAAEAEGGAS